MKLLKYKRPKNNNKLIKWLKDYWNGFLMENFNVGRKMAYNFKYLTTHIKPYRHNTEQY